MPFQSLKSKIAVNLAFIILITTVLSCFVAIHVVQKHLIQAGVEHGRRLMAVWPLPSINGGTDGCRAWLSAADAALKGSSFIYAEFRTVTDTACSRGLLPDDLNPALHQQISRVLESRQPLVQYDGETWGVFWHQSRYALISEPVKSPDGGFSGATTIVFQLDEIYRTLRQSQKVIIWYVGANFLVLLILGTYRLSRLVIRPIHKFIKMTDAYRDKDRLYFSHGRKFYEFNQLSKALNQMIEKIEKNKENLQDAFNRLEQSNRELKNAQDEIIKAEKLASIGRLSAGIAHEIGNPIGIVLGYIDLLKSRPGLKTDDTAQDYLFRASDEIGRIHGIIRQLLDFSRSAPLHFECIPMHDLVHDVVDIMSHQSLMNHISILCRLSAADHRVTADYQQIRQVLVNLMINAADAIQGSPNALHGKITIETESLTSGGPLSLADKPTFLLRITDNGAGIPQKDIENIFDPFYTTKEPGKGTGLGLSVSYRIVEQTGGTITVWSEEGKGSTLMIVLPLCEKQGDG